MAHYFTNYGCFLIGFTILCGIICVLIYKLTRLRPYKRDLGFPGPSGLPFLGNALDFVGSTEDILNKTIEYSKFYNSSPFRVWLGSILIIFISHPEHIKRLLNSNKAIEKSVLYTFFLPWMGNGLISAPAKIWRVHRKLIGPTFNLKILESYVSVFAAQSRILADKMEMKANEPEFEIFDYVSLCTLDIICETAMGVTVDAQRKSDPSYVGAVQTAFSTLHKRIFSPWLHPDAIFYRTQIGKDHKKSIETLHSFTDDVIGKKTEAFLHQNDPESTIDQKDDELCTTSSVIDPPPKRKTYLDLLMGSTNNEMKLSSLELRSEVDTMVAAGNDTSAQTICFTMLMLAIHQDVQEKVYQELYEIYGSCDVDERNVTHEDLPRMEYMERVIKETLRLFPVASIISRSVTEELNIGEDYTLPKGCTAIVSILAIHRSEEYWTDPLKFVPDRFLPEEIAKRHTYCYLPFSAGPRNCIGARFAMMEMKTILATVLRRYHLKKDNIIAVSDIRLKSDTITKPVDPIALRIERRL